MQVMRFNNNSNWTRGFYSKEYNESDIIEMEGSIICKMFLDKEKGFGFEDYILLYNRNNEGWHELTRNVRLDLFLNESFTYAFIKEIKE